MENKKEIWIEKLIRYLLESKWEEYKEEYYEWYRDVELEQNIDSLSELKPFIKWLVDNDKIDREKCWFKNEWLSWNWYDSGIAFVQNYDNDTFKVSEFYSPYLQLLMLLSISNSPIEDLVSYLR